MCTNFKFQMKILCSGLTLGIFLSLLLWTTPIAAAADGETGVNDSIETATEITAGYYAGFSIGYLGDKDYYNISLAMGANISVTICNMITLFQLYLSDTMGTLRNSSPYTSILGDSQKVWWFNVPLAGNYTIEVNASGSQTGDYDMRIEAPVIDDSWEENDDFASAREIGEDSITSDLQLYDSDYYKVSLERGDYLNITIRRSSVEASGFFNCSIFNSSQGLLTDRLLTPGDEPTILIQAGLTDWYYVVVENSSHSGLIYWGNYTLILQDVADDIYENNDDADHAAPVDLDRDEWFYGFSAVLLDDDWYQYQLNAGEIMWFCTSVSENFSFQITDSKGAVLADPVIFSGYPFQDALYANYSVPTNGTYKLHVFSTGIPHIVQYGLYGARMNVSHPADITYQANQTGNTITWHVDDSFWGKIPASYGLTMTAKVYRDGVLLPGSYTWNRTTPVSVNVDGLPEGNHTFKIVATDGANNIIEDTVIVTVQAAETPPNGIPGYPGIFLTGFALVTIAALASRKKYRFSQK